MITVFTAPTVIKEELIGSEKEGTGKKITREEMEDLENPGYHDYTTGEEIKYYKSSGGFTSYQKSNDPATNVESAASTITNLSDPSKGSGIAEPAEDPSTASTKGKGVTEPAGEPSAISTNTYLSDPSKGKGVAEPAGEPSAVSTNIDLSDPSKGEGIAKPTENHSFASTNINLRNPSKGKGKETDLDPDFMKCKANQLPPLWISLIGGHACNCLVCKPAFEKQVEVRMIRVVHNEKKAVLFASTEDRSFLSMILPCSSYHLPRLQAWYYERKT